ncbi:Mu-like prophage major head subunit gpT family protein [Paremcibacter congregatus]|uniref:Mu-like prophage major head subunit gpT family protein n=1 Tax=Paremcibacter congregatus TaxID=2043170 RepID=UPI0030ECEF27|tara:strand:+ start:6875 stop:7768 length:894 start_codon:yes stop_codon:yes gene_type:complete
MQITSTSLAALMIGFKSEFKNGLDTAESQYKTIAMDVNSTKGAETYGWLGKTTRFRKWLGDRVIQNLKTHDFTIKNEPFENTVGVDRDDIEDDSLGLYSPLFKQMGQDTANHPDELVFDLWKKGFTEKCYDGQYFFDTDHPAIDEDGNEYSVSNMQAGAGPAWYLIDNSKALMPVIFQKRRPYDFASMDKKDDTNVFLQKEYLYGIDARVNAGYGLWQLAFGSKATLNKANYDSAFEAMQSLKGDHGKPLNVTPKVLLVPPTLRAVALEMVKAERDAAGATNVNRGTTEVVVCPWLA